MMQIGVDTCQIDTSDPEIRRVLATDLRRMNLLAHPGKPPAADVYTVTVVNDLCYPSLLFEINYGVRVRNKFVPLGKPVFYTTETLPDE